MTIVPLTQRTPAWHAWRAQGITASEAPIIVGCSPYKSPWQLSGERTGVLPTDDLSRNPHVQRGIQYEDRVRQGFETRHDTLLLPFCVQSAQSPVLRASLDGLSDDDEPVELKVPSRRTYQALLRHGAKAMAYRMAWVQLQHQLVVTEADQGWLVFDPCLPECPVLEFRIDADRRFQQRTLIPACLAFWEQLEISSTASA
ncbi:YqaJ viral recombinase family protein [Lamprobacter modestohalophilus]|uniref:lambda-exonuclease family protein n=1 Tax=Lamprobacter modestohalophilus TaxID=1064514 RepID=UPI002ADEE36E|nr:YqaJ viral recombinase family protein [Lamprobacter modestohalophilus]MEA1049093.1 YqaJ viral recombinase family protein [Lamprobacter modestohalophilus]